MEQYSQTKTWDFNKYDPSFFKRCIICGEGYFKRRRDVIEKWDTRKYCTHKCYFPMQRFRIISPETRKKISAASTGRKHTPEARKNFSLAKMGDKNPAKREDVRRKISATLMGHKYSKRGAESPSWRGGKTPFIANLRGWSEYSAWRKSIFERDNWTCVLCGAKNGIGVGKSIILNADHYPVPLYKIVEEMVVGYFDYGN